MRPQRGRAPREAGRGAYENDAGVAQGPEAILRRHAEMEAHDRRTLFQQHGEHVVVFDKALVDRRQRGRRLGAQALEFGTQPFDPGCIYPVVRLRRLMAEQIHVEGAVGALPDGGDHRAGAGGIGRPDADRTEPAGIRDRRRHGRRRHPGHRCLNDRHADLEQVEQCRGFRSGHH
jgi:hypothetical protein